MGRLALRIGAEGVAQRCQPKLDDSSAKHKPSRRRDSLFKKPLIKKLRRS